jgi:starch phosphorylase
VFTTHTPVDAGHDKFPYDLVSRISNDLLPIDELKALAGHDRLNMTQLALNLSGYVNGVARRHATTARSMFPGYDVRAITNGVHAETWTHPAFSALYQAHFPQWAYDPEVLVRADHLENDAVWAAHQQAKADLCRIVGEITGITFQKDVPIIGFARRMTGYKRPDLLFSDVARLATIAEHHPFQVVVAGKAHPRDTQGKDLIRGIHQVMQRLQGKVPIAFLPNYDMEIAKVLVSGADIWLNTPLPPLEASGTSGMKAALNGVLNFSTLDGWWIEGCMEGSTGWAIEAEDGHPWEAEDLYRKLADVILPLYYHDRTGWIWMMKQAISKLASYFNSHRMMRRYAADAYIR